MSSNDSSMSRCSSALRSFIEEHAKLIYVYRVKLPPLPPYSDYPLNSLQQTPSPTVNHSLIPPTCHIGSCAWATLHYFLVAPRAVLYRGFGMRDVGDFDASCILLVTWRDLTVITIDSGLSLSPRTRSDGQPSLFSFSAPVL